MLSKSSSKQATSRSSDSIDTLVGNKTVIQGDIEFSGGLRIDGRITGNVKSVDGSGGTLVLSETAVIDGNITVPHVIANGTVNGNVIASEKFELQSKAVINGDVRYRAIEMALGASVNGAMVNDSASSSVGVKLKKARKPERHRSSSSSRESDS